MAVGVSSIKIASLSFLLAASLIAASCQKSAPPRTDNQPAATPTSTAPRTGSPSPVTPDPATRPSPRTPLETALNDMAVFNFVQVFVFTRLDGKPMDQTDYDVLKANAPKETNQWAKSTDGVHIVAGTNFVFKPEQLSTLRTRFAVEDVTATYGRKR
jgi:hypothetical protein